MSAEIIATAAFLWLGCNVRILVVLMRRYFQEVSA